MSLPIYLNKGLVYSITGRKLTEGFEGVRLVAYQDQNGIWTIGYGHTGPEVVEGYTITQEEADLLLAHDILTAANFVIRVVTVPLTQNEFDACVDFTFNCGVGSFLHSTLLKLINQQDFKGAATAFELWDKVAGKVNAGLQRRRLAEEELFNHLEPQAAA